MFGKERVSEVRYRAGRCGEGNWVGHCVILRLPKLPVAKYRIQQDP